MLKIAIRSAVALILFAGTVQAGGIDRLREFVEGAKTLRAQFNQTVLDRAGKVTNESSGTMQFSRPGKFRWEYTKPFPQLIVGDGKKLWIWDGDLEQVTVKKLSESLGSSPAALLAGSNEIERSFTLIDGGNTDGLDWLQAQPKDRDTTFESIRMGFGDAGLQVMELVDSFGQKTLIRFAKVEKNPKLAADLFKFTPPKNADVVGE
jgi:outer membrane lipoprotein carrier protein